ncbi:MAG: hypothetical protein V3T74_00140 [Gemmatimonadales bacterium]
MRNHPSRHRFWLTGTALACAAVIGLAGCSDSTGPDDVFDPVAANEAAGDVGSALAGNPALTSMAVMGAFFPDFAAAPIAATVPFDPQTAEDGRHWIDKRRDAFQAWSEYDSPDGPAAVTFPADLLGKTLVFNPLTEQYEVDPARDGEAPSNGLRLVLYAVDPILHQIVEPLTEVGYLELTDQDTPAMDAVGIVAVISSVTVLDYLASAQVTTTSITFTADGFLTDGTTRVDFLLSVAFDETAGSITIDYDVDVDADQAGVHLVMVLTEATQSTDVTLTINHGANEVVFHVTLTETSMVGSVTHNGDTVIDISGTPDQPIFTDHDGNELTEAQLFAVGQMFEAAGEVLDHLDDLLGPAVAVLQIPVYAS